MCHAAFGLGVYVVAVMSYEHLLMLQVLRGAVENAARDGIIYEPECRTISSTTDSRFATLPDDPKTFCYGFYTFPS